MARIVEQDGIMYMMKDQVKFADKLFGDDNADNILMMTTFQSFLNQSWLLMFQAQLSTCVGVGGYPIVVFHYWKRTAQRHTGLAI